MLFLTVIFHTLFTVSSLSALANHEAPMPVEQASIDQKKTQPTKTPLESIIHGLTFGIASQYLYQEAFSENSVLRVGKPAVSTLPLEFRYYIEDELVADDDVMQNIFRGIGDIGTAYYELCHNYRAVWNATDRETGLRSAIIHACDGSYDELMSKNSSVFYKALFKILVRCVAASTVFACRNNGQTTIQSFKYRYGLFELLVPLIDLSEKLPIIRNGKKIEKKRVSRLVKSCMRFAVYTALALETASL